MGLNQSCGGEDEAGVDSGYKWEGPGGTQRHTGLRTEGEDERRFCLGKLGGGHRSHWGYGGVGLRGGSFGVSLVTLRACAEISICSSCTVGSENW